MASISNDTLRTWRARGLLPEHKHWTGSYDSLQVCALAIRKVMVTQGASPGDTARIGQRYAPTVLCAALSCAPRLIEVRGAMASSAGDLEKLAIEDAARLVGLITRADEALGTRYLVSGDQDDYEPVLELDDHFRRPCASLRCVDLQALGGEIAQLAPRPLLVLEEQ